VAPTNPLDRTSALRPVTRENAAPSLSVMRESCAKAARSARVAISVARPASTL